MSVTRIRKMHLRDYQQFRHCTLDFTGPDGRALDRVCLIGRNGTGKSTILRLIDDFVTKTANPYNHVIMEIEHNNQRFLINDNTAIFDITHIDGDLLLSVPSFLDLTTSIKGLKSVNIPSDLRLQHGKDLLVYCPAEVEQNAGLQLSGMPQTKLDQALAFFKEDFPFYHLISNDRIAEMWRILIYLVKRRENDRQTFELREDSLQKTKAQLIAEFDQANPAVLQALARLWNHILAPANLEFDVSAARVPIQLTDNLEAWIRRRDTGERVPYSMLSTGIRNFIFRIGHLYLLYFNRQIDRGFVLVDEPEDSLFPDFLFELMQIYEEILRDANGQTRTQLFMATHSPIIAAQFEPYERIILEWGSDGFVTASKGVAPKGDDPNDLLRKDFHLNDLMGDAGRKSWQKYLDLRRQIRAAPESDKAQLIAQAAEIAQAYSFEPPR